MQCWATRANIVTGRFHAKYQTLRRYETDEKIFTNYRWHSDLGSAYWASTVHNALDSTINTVGVASREAINRCAIKANSLQRQISRGTIRWLDGVSHKHPAAGSSPAPATKFEHVTVSNSGRS